MFCKTIIEFYEWTNRSKKKLFRWLNYRLKCGTFSARFTNEQFQYRKIIFHFDVTIDISIHFHFMTIYLFRLTMIDCVHCWFGFFFAFVRLRILLIWEYIFLFDFDVMRCDLRPIFLLGFEGEMFVSFIYSLRWTH